MKCDINKTSREYKKELDVPGTSLSALNGCIQYTIDNKLDILVQNEKRTSSSESIRQDDVTYNSMNKHTLALYTSNFYYVVFKLSLFVILIGMYFLLSK